MMHSDLPFRRLVARGIAFHWRMHLSVALGTAVAGAVLVGALLVGDSVRWSLRQFALMRLGSTRFAVETRNRMFADDLAETLSEQVRAEVAAVLSLRGIAVWQSPGGDSRQVNHIQVLGVDPAFWRLGGVDAGNLKDDEVVLSRKLATALAVAPGDEIALRVGKPTLMPRDAPLASRKEALSKRGTFRVARIVADGAMGRFSLSANQVAPFNAFVNRSWLQDAVGLTRRANLLLVGQVRADGDAHAALTNALERIWDVGSVGVALRAVPERDIVQLESDRVFLEPDVSRAAMDRDSPRWPPTVGVLAYLANAISTPGVTNVRSTPYSFVVAASPSDDRTLSPVPLGMRDDEVVVNRWTADRLRVGPGAAVVLSYYEIAGSGDFVERKRSFTVRSVVEMDALALERKLMPHFPGLTDVDKCREWDIGMPMDEAMLADKANEEYWDRYRATPKAFVTLAAGQQMWANRFGNLSSVRYRMKGADAAEMRGRVNRRVRPESVGLFFVPVREHALRAVDQAMSFGELFLGMSSFLIAAALMLTGLLFVFGVQRRAEEMGVLLAVGMAPARVRRVFLAEGAFVSVAGAVCGALAGTGYTRLLVWGLGTYWQGAVANAAIQYHADASSVVSGIGATVLCAVGSLAAAIWRQGRRPARELLALDFSQASAARGSGRASAWWAVGSAAAALGTVGWAAVSGSTHAAAAFFGAGALLLLSGMGFARLSLARQSAAEGALTIRGLGRRNTSRRRGRSLTAVALLGCGCFLVLAVTAMQEDVRTHARERWSGTGGFAFYGESTLGVPDAPGSPKGRKAFRLDDAALAGVEFVSLKAHDGDDASCFNLNRAQAPRLLGVDPGELKRRGAFQSAKGPSPWDLLEAKDLPPDTVPGLVGDANTAMWSLQRKAHPAKGDAIAYKDERGNVFKVRLVGTLPVRLSVLTGTVLIPMRAFGERFPSEDGFRVFLVDVPPGRDTGAVRGVLAAKLERVGLDLVAGADRLAEFSSVESTYLAVFMVLGGLGLVLGTAGLGIVVLRNVMERRQELAAMRCMGFSRAALCGMIETEHRMLLLIGAGIGCVSSLVAVIPSLLSMTADIPLLTLGAIIAGVALFGLGSIALAARLALRGDVMSSLRQE